MSNCPLAVTGASNTVVVLSALLLVAVGFVMLVIGRRRDIGRGAAVILALAVGVAAFAVVDSSTAAAESACPAATGSTQAGIANGTDTTAMAPTSTPSTTTPSTSTSTTPTSTTTSTASTSTTTSTTSTTTTIPVPDVTPSISGPTTAVPGEAGTFTVEATNVGAAPTAGVMTFDLLFDIEPTSGSLDLAPLASTDWTFVGAIPGGLRYESNPGFVLAAGASSSTTFRATWSPMLGPSGEFTIAMTLPAGSGNETNAANNSASHTVVVSTSP